MDIDTVKKSLEDALRSVNSTAELEALRSKYIGRKGVLAELTAAIPSLPPEQRRTKTNIRKLTKDTALMPSGLFGPVKLLNASAGSQ